MLHDALFVFQFLSFMRASLNHHAWLKGIKGKRLLGDNPTLVPTVLVCSHDYAIVVIMFYCFCFNKVPTKAFGIVWMIVDLKLCKNRNFCAQSRNFENSLERAFDMKFLQVIDIQILYVFLIFLNFWSCRSMAGVQITINCSVFNRFCFQCIVCLFSSFHGLYCSI